LPPNYFPQFEEFFKTPIQDVRISTIFFN